MITSSAAVGVEFRHPVAFRRAILCILSILLKFVITVMVSLQSTNENVVFCL